MFLRNAASILENESGILLEPVEISEFRHAVLQGDWDLVERLVPRCIPPDRQESALFTVLEQQYLEFLEDLDMPGALQVLRGTLSSLQHDPARLHELSRYEYYI
jgi:hypothetical protein